MKIFVSGIINIETTAAVRGFPINYTQIEYPFYGVNSNVSGVGYNVAKALKTLGDEIDMYSYIGDDEESERVLGRMKKDGISSRHIVKKLKNTAASVVLYDPQGKRQIYSDLKDAQEQSIDIKSAESDLKACDAAALCNIGFNRELIKHARKIGVLTATDVHVLGDINDEYNRDFMENADILFLSDERLPCAPEEFINQLEQRYRNKIIVVGMGAKGAMLYDRDKDELCVIPAYSGAKVVNTVGAGDALFSSFLHFFIKLGDAKAALQRAVVFAGIKIGSNGASNGFCAEDEINKYF